MPDINPCFLDTEFTSESVHAISVSLYIVATLVGYILNAYLFIVLVIGWKEYFAGEHFYRQVLEISFASFVYLLSYPVVVIPYTIFQKPYLPEPALISVASLRVFGFYLSIYLSFEIAIDRTLLFYSRTLHEGWTKYEMPRAIVIWFGAVITAVVPTSFGCYEQFNPIGYYFTLKCSSCSITPYFSFITVLLIVGVAVPLATIFTYVLLVVKIRQMVAMTSTQTETKSTEIDLTIKENDLSNLLKV
ncbi:hypothetical protein Tcan_13850 [Toxocara canis]|uniref:G-protein coupled receptors family 1 profile domain-containing protein n=1 Tax=Toxocara canis TaxID=6265 RepID=A0A0B2VAK5_TOXCA|nr:hypothetical protein Tcan_13850 [Toxocara canis]